LEPTNLEPTPKADRPKVLPVVCVCLVLVLAVLGVFGQTVGFGFVNYDDGENVYDNPVVAKGLSARAVGWAFTHKQVANWIPVTTLSHMLDCDLFGLHAGGHHLVNVLLHAANAVLLFLVLLQLSGSLWRSAFVAGLFALHPLRAESVAWVSERKDVLCAFFFILTIWAYTRYAAGFKVQSPKSKVYYALALVLFAFGLMAKPMVATLPFVLLLLDYWPLGRLHNRQEFLPLVREKIPLFVLAAGSCMAAVLVPGLVVSQARQLPILERLGNALVSYMVYLRQMVYPTKLAIPYPLAPNGQPMWKVCAAFVLLAAITAVVVACRKKRPCLLVGWLWYLGMLLPVIGIIQISHDAAHADRYTYLPAIGLAIAGIWVVADWSAGSKPRQVILGGLMIAVIGASGFRGYVQTSYWQDDHTLWTHALACNPNNSVALNNVGYAFYQSGDSTNAIACYRQALQVRPDFALAHGNLGVALFGRGDVPHAIAEYRKALEFDPDYADAHMNLGVALGKSGQFEEAFEHYRKAQEIKPNSAEVHVDEGLTLLSQGHADEAIVQFRAALEVRPDFTPAYCNMGEALLAKGKPDEAIAQYRKALEIKPADAEALSSLGKALLRKGDFKQALTFFQKTPGMSPDPLAAWFKLGNDFLRKKDSDEAIACFRQAMAIDTNSAGAWAKLGLAFYQKTQTKDAIESWQKSLEINPDQSFVQNSLAWALATAPDASLRDGPKAVALVKQVIQQTPAGNPSLLHTLAAAYAEEGNYALATAVAGHALKLANEQKNNALAATLQKEIKLYEADTPVRTEAH
jgi:tetratricopeptide (TPR) repeat protein